MGLATILKSVNKGFIKDALTGAGLGFGTSAVVLVALNAAILGFKNSIGGLSADLMGLAHIAGFDFLLSAVLGAYVARAVQNSGKLTLKKLGK